LLAEQVHARWEAAWVVARQAAELLRTDFQVIKVMVFGSLVHKELFHLRSDVDLAVWGLDELEYFRAVGRLQSLDAQYSVDLILFEDAQSGLQKVIQREGVAL
jgi:predicted nucleotidyltransferase